MSAATIRWIPVTEQLPDDETTVLVAMSHSFGDPVWPGYHDGEFWQLADGMALVGTNGVIHWAEMPEPPKTQ